MLQDTGAGEEPPARTPLASSAPLGTTASKVPDYLQGLSSHGRVNED